MLQKVYGPQATFREGQEEAVRSVLDGKRVLVVQKTGWGKSLVYFLSAKILRQRGKGLCIIISPLLALMRNQLDAAKAWGLHAVKLDSSNSEAWAQIEFDLAHDRVDILFITPERLGNTEFVEGTLAKIPKQIGMLVIDEAHCISDWGHDFRPDYLRIVKIIQQLPPNVPLLATTATANNRVIDDIRSQMGNRVEVLRGPLARASLRIHILHHLRTKAERLAWLAENLPKFSGTGIIYCLTTGDCESVSRWLQRKGLAVLPYHSGKKEGMSEDDVKAYKLEAEGKFFHNEVKALVATVALGMGVDKPDIRFIIHWQRPGNLIAYYQQIGRAGRDGKAADAVLMLGEEDDAISRFFIRAAFPSPEEMDDVERQIADHDGMRLRDLEQACNLSNTKITQALKLLEVHDAIYKDKSTRKYYRTTHPWHFDELHVDEITRMREAEMREMQAYAQAPSCLMQYVTARLDDPHPHACGKCDVCRPQGALSELVDPAMVREADAYLHQDALKILPRKQDGNRHMIPERERMRPGFALSNYADAGWGALVKKDKYQSGCFSQLLIDASVKFLRPYCRNWGITLVTAVPSRRCPHLVPDFARAVAMRLGLPYQDCLEKTMDAPEQKMQNNSAWQSQNAEDSFEACGQPHGMILLIDDMVDSRWTFTVCARKLLQAGAAAVYPFALANTGKQ